MLNMIIYILLQYLVELYITIVGILHISANIKSMTTVIANHISRNEQRVVENKNHNFMLEVSCF